MSKARFCPDCANLLHPREERSSVPAAAAGQVQGTRSKPSKQLVLACRMCGHVEPPKHADRPITSHELQELAEVWVPLSPELLHDPSLQRTRGRPCPNCQHDELLVIGTTAKSLGPLAIVFMCTNNTCYHHFSESPSIRVHCNIPLHTHHNPRAARQQKYHKFGYSRPAEVPPSQLTQTFTPATSATWNSSQATLPTQPPPYQLPFTRPTPPPLFQRPRYVPPAPRVQVTAPAPTPTPTPTTAPAPAPAPPAVSRVSRLVDMESKYGGPDPDPSPPFRSPSPSPSPSPAPAPWSPSDPFPYSQPRIYGSQVLESKEEADFMLSQLSHQESLPDLWASQVIQQPETATPTPAGAGCEAGAGAGAEVQVSGAQADDAADEDDGLQLTPPDEQEQVFQAARARIEQMSLDRQLGITTSSSTPETQQEEQDPYAS